jgi:hypothetical protein
MSTLKEQPRLQLSPIRERTYALTKFNIDSIPAACSSSLARSGTTIEFMIECLPNGNVKPYVRPRYRLNFKQLSHTFHEYREVPPVTVAAHM